MNRGARLTCTAVSARMRWTRRQVKGFVPPRVVGLSLRFATGDDLARGTRM
jgi:hypothetical protein